RPLPPGAKGPGKEATMRRHRVHIEELEDRTAPAVFGVPWPDPGHLTLSLVPDGTGGGLGASELFRVLDARFPRDAWQRELLRAFQPGAQDGTLDIGLVADGGQALGAPGAPQGAPRFGDIRVAAYPMSPAALALASPFGMTAGTWSGDVKLSSALLGPNS